MKKNGYTNKELIILITILSIIFLIVLFKLSGNFKNTKSELYDKEMKYILACCKKYATENKSTNNTKLTVNELVLNKYIAEDTENHEVYDPRDNTKTLNDLKLKITLKDDIYQCVFED